MSDETQAPPESPPKRRGGWPKGKPRKMYSSAIARQAAREGLRVLVDEKGKFIPPEPKIEASVTPITATPPQAEPVAVPHPQPQAPTPQNPAAKYKMKHALDWEGEFVPDDQSAIDQLRIDAVDFPTGMDLKWVTETVYGQPFPQRLADAQRSGWGVVDSGDFDGKYRGKFASIATEGPIRKDGLVLVARPMWISKKFKGKQEADALRPINIKMQALRSGNLPGVSQDAAQHESATGFNKVNRTIERVDIPKD